MTAPLVQRMSLATLGLAILAAAAPAAHAQAQPRWQVEASLDQTGPSSYVNAIVDPSTFRRSQQEVVRYSVGASRLARLGPRTSLRLGLSFSNKGFEERTTTGGHTSTRRVQMLYLGVPLTLGYNLVDARPGRRMIAEAGVVPELLLREGHNELGWDLRPSGLSYLLRVGAKFDLKDGRALVVGPELRWAATDYARHPPQVNDLRPATVGLKAAIQF